MCIIKVEDISKIYGKNRLAVQALKGLNLAFKKGALVSIMGPSGCGKTTFLNILGALDRPTSGRIILDGVDLFSMPESRLYVCRRDKIGFVFQLFHLLPALSALENVLAPAIPWNGANRRLQQRASELLELVGLAGKEKHRPGQLSGGEQQRVAIARAMILDPPILLADEPTGNLDRPGGRKIIELLCQLNQDMGKTILITTHDPALAKYCGEVVRLENGKLHSMAENIG